MPENIKDRGYGQSKKAHVRQTMWRALNDSVSDKTRYVLALAAMRFHDKKLAKRYGFVNVLGVDLSPKVVEHNNHFDRTILQAPLSELLISWPLDKPTGAVIADYCSNISSGDVQRSILGWLLHSPHADSCLFLNVMKGRETGSANFMLHQLETITGQPMAKMNRAVGAIQLVITQMIMKNESLLGNSASPLQLLTPVLEEADDVMKKHIAMCGSYTGKGNMRMDYVLMRPLPAFALVRQDLRSLAKNSKLERHITAKLAWHTRRQPCQQI